MYDNYTGGLTFIKCHSKTKLCWHSERRRAFGWNCVLHFHYLQKWPFVPNDKLTFEKIIISLYNLSVIKAAITSTRLYFTLCDGQREREPLGVPAAFFEARFQTQRKHLEVQCKANTFPGPK